MNILNKFWWWNWRRRFRKAARKDIANTTYSLRARQELARRIGAEVPHV